MGSRSVAVLPARGIGRGPVGSTRAPKAWPSLARPALLVTMPGRRRPAGPTLWLPRHTLFETRAQHNISASSRADVPENHPIPPPSERSRQP